jgi:jumonji domain-containing protein 7
MEGKLLNAFILTAQEAKDLWVPKKIKAIENVEPLEFYREFVARNVPAVIKNQVRWKALDKWTNGYLIDKIKHEITVAETPDGRADAIKDGKFVLPREVKKRIGDFFTELKDKSKVCYIQKQNSSIDLEFQELREDFEELEFGNAIFGRKPEATNIWIGDERSISSLHKDPYENLYVVVSGKKTFTLLPPTDTPFLYK